MLSIYREQYNLLTKNISFDLIIYKFRKLFTVVTKIKI